MAHFRELPENDVCTQQRLRSTWASAQSDQSSLSEWRKLGSLATCWAHSKDWSVWGMPRLIWAVNGHTFHFVGLSCGSSLDCLWPGFGCVGSLGVHAPEVSAHLVSAQSGLSTNLAGFSSKWAIQLAFWSEHSVLAENTCQNTIKTLNFGTDRHEQTVQTQISLQSDQVLDCLPFFLHLLDALLYA